ncbi:hypothetical protein P355_4860 [Burkholderia cenocepacia KC-01]|nr:hypothetical protein P355_4860 [Burkholderia cenocepacia KC-01]
MQCSTPIGTDALRLRARGGVANPCDASGIAAVCFLPRTRIRWRISTA